MVHEVRRIILTSDELLAAFDGYRRITPNFLPEGQIMNCAPEEGAVRVTIRKMTSTQEYNTDIMVRGMDAVKPLIRFCLENNIMIPKDGQKSFYVKDGSASLYIVLNINLEMVSPTYIASDTTRSLSPEDVLKAVALTA